MVIILDGNLVVGAHVRRDLCYLTCLRHLFKSKGVKNRISFSTEKTYFPATYSELPSNISTMVWLGLWSNLIFTSSQSRVGYTRTILE